MLAAFLIIYYGRIQIRSMHGFFGIHELPEMFSLLISYFSVIVIINSFNLIDGVDGLAGTLGLMSSALFGIYFMNAAVWSLIMYLHFLFAAACWHFSYLIFNLPKYLWATRDHCSLE